MDDMHYRWGLSDGVAVVEVTTPEIKHPQQAQELGAQLRALLGAGERRIVLDLGHVTYMSSTGFAALMGFGKAVSEAGGVVRIGGMTHDVRFGAGIIHLADIIPIDDDRETALAALTG